MSDDGRAGARVFVIDAMPLLYRGHFVFLKNPMITSDGINVSALHGFAATLVHILEKHKPTHVAVVFDSAKPTFRHERYPEYKAQRDKAPEELIAAIPMATEMAKAMNIPVLRVDGVEADDVLGTLSVMAEAEGDDCFVVTPDKDAAQLVSEKVKLFRPGRGNAPAEIWGVSEVCAKWGLSSADQVVDLLGMMGDAADNIPGIPGVGEKTAVKLLQKFGSLEGLLSRTDELKGKQKEKVEQNVDLARLSRELVVIKRDVPLTVTIADLKLQAPDRETLGTFLKRYELSRISRRLLGNDDTQAAQVKPDKELKTAGDVKHQYVLIDSADKLRCLVDELSQVPLLTLDTETTSVDPHQADLVGISLTFGSQAIPSFTLARMLKEWKPEVHITMGGGLLAYVAEKLATRPEVWDLVEDRPAFANYLQDGVRKYLNIDSDA